MSRNEPGQISCWSEPLGTHQEPRGERAIVEFVDFGIGSSGFNRRERPMPPANGGVAAHGADPTNPPNPINRRSLPRPLCVLSGRYQKRLFAEFRERGRAVTPARRYVGKARKGANSLRTHGHWTDTAGPLHAAGPLLSQRAFPEVARKVFGTRGGSVAVSPAPLLRPQRFDRLNARRSTCGDDAGDRSHDYQHQGCEGERECVVHRDAHE